MAKDICEPPKELVERAVLRNLKEAWNAFVRLPRTHYDHLDEFRAAIHAAQGIVAVKMMQRREPELFPISHSWAISDNFDKDNKV